MNIYFNKRRVQVGCIVLGAGINVQYFIALHRAQGETPVYRDGYVEFWR